MTASATSALDVRALAFLAGESEAGMITIRRNGVAHMARVHVALVDGRVLATGGENLVRTRNLRRDPRCSLFVFAAHPNWLGLETTVIMHEGEAGADLQIRYLEALGRVTPDGLLLGHDPDIDADRPYLRAEFHAQCLATGRLTYEFEVQRAYGNY